MLKIKENVKKLLLMISATCHTSKSCTLKATDTPDHILQCPHANAIDRFREHSLFKNQYPANLNLLSLIDKYEGTGAVVLLITGGNHVPKESPFHDKESPVSKRVEKIRLQVSFLIQLSPNNRMNRLLRTYYIQHGDLEYKAFSWLRTVISGVWFARENQYSNWAIAIAGANPRHTWDQVTDCLKQEGDRWIEKEAHKCDIELLEEMLNSPACQTGVSLNLLDIWVVICTKKRFDLWERVLQPGFFVRPKYLPFWESDKVSERLSYIYSVVTDKEDLNTLTNFIADREGFLGLDWIELQNMLSHALSIGPSSNTFAWFIQHPNAGKIHFKYWAALAALFLSRKEVHSMLMKTLELMKDRMVEEGTGDIRGLGWIMFEKDRIESVKFAKKWLDLLIKMASSHPQALERLRQIQAKKYPSSC